MAGGLGREACRISFSLPWQIILTLSCSSAIATGDKAWSDPDGGMSALRKRLGLKTVTQREWFQPGRFCQGYVGLGLSEFGAFPPTQVMPC